MDFSALLKELGMSGGPEEFHDAMEDPPELDGPLLTPMVTKPKDRQAPKKRKVVPIKSKVGHVSKMNKLYHEIEKDKEEGRAPKRPKKVQPSEVKEGPAKLEKATQTDGEQKKIPEVIVLQPMFHVNVHV